MTYVLWLLKDIWRWQCRVRVTVQNNNTFIKDPDSDECMVKYKISSSQILCCCLPQMHILHFIHFTQESFRWLQHCRYNRYSWQWEQTQQSRNTVQYTQAFIETFIKNLRMKNTWPCCCSHLVYKIDYIFKKCSKSLGGSRQPLIKMYSQSFTTT